MSCTVLTRVSPPRSNMETPTELEDVAGSQIDVAVANRDYDDGSIITVDFGPVAGEPSVDVVGGTAIVVVDGEQFEFDVPTDADEVSVNGGILTIEG